ncbi:MAG: ribosome biogenesis GTPase YlqF [Mycoplasmataceae bacterium]|nr:ribosome biogenesis GTPase YlqF [Mycoplasmataceae bacterium]
MAINWFPGHMARTLRDIQGAQNLDLIIEVVDARAIHISSNPELTLNFKKEILTIALKSDLADLQNVRIPENTIVGSIKDRQFKNKIINAIDNIFVHKITKLKSKGLLVPQFYIMVVGLPNVGKSSLINFLASSNKLIVENRPGVTKTKQLVKINQNYFLYDSPGVLVKKIDNEVDGYKLALIGTIKKDVLPLDEVVSWGYQFLKNNYMNQLESKYGMTENLDFYAFMNLVCEKYKFIRSDLKLDTDRGIDFIFNEMLNGRIAKVNYEK